MAKFKRDPKRVERAAEEALEWIERQTEGLVIDCKDSLRLALTGSLRPLADIKAAALANKKSMESLHVMQRARAKAGLGVTATRKGGLNV